MKSRQLAEMLTEFAGLAEPSRAHQLRKLAAVFGSGDDDTVTARLKQMSTASSHPGLLKQSLEHIHLGFAAAGAKQAATLEKILGLFGGRGDAVIESFISDITTTTPPKRRRAAAPPALDHRLAKDMADRLTDSTLDTEAFNKVVQELRSAKLVNTPTLISIAHRYLDNDRPYQGRKAAIEDIVERQKADAREHARGKALSRVGV